MDKAPIATLKNGVRVANFSSPHPFTFDDGTVLPACSAERARSLMVKVLEREIEKDKWTDIRLIFFITVMIRTELENLQTSDDMDIILVPQPVMETMKNDGFWRGMCRVCCVKDRVTKTIHSDRFCI